MLNLIRRKLLNINVRLINSFGESLHHVFDLLMVVPISTSTKSSGPNSPRFAARCKNPLPVQTGNQKPSEHSEGPLLTKREDRGVVFKRILDLVRDPLNT